MVGIAHDGTSSRIDSSRFLLFLVEVGVRGRGLVGFRNAMGEALVGVAGSGGFADFRGVLLAPGARAESR